MDTHHPYVSITHTKLGKRKSIGEGTKWKDVCITLKLMYHLQAQLASNHVLKERGNSCIQKREGVEENISILTWVRAHHMPLIAAVESIFGDGEVSKVLSEVLPYNYIPTTLLGHSNPFSSTVRCESQLLSLLLFSTPSLPYCFQQTIIHQSIHNYRLIYFLIGISSVFLNKDYLLFIIYYILYKG